MRQNWDASPMQWLVLIYSLPAAQVRESALVCRELEQTAVAAK